MLIPLPEPDGRTTASQGRKGRVAANHEQAAAGPSWCYPSLLGTLPTKDKKEQAES